MHFFNPAPLMPLVEIVRAELLRRDDAFDAAYAFGEKLGKHPIRCHDTPGFVVNRVLIPLLNDCVRVLDEARVTRRGPRRRDEARRRLADGAVRAARPRRHRRARARERGALGEAARAADGARRRVSSRWRTRACSAARAAAASTRTTRLGGEPDRRLGRLGDGERLDRRGRRRRCGSSSASSSDRGHRRGGRGGEQAGGALAAARRRRAARRRARRSARLRAAAAESWCHGADASTRGPTYPRRRCRPPSRASTS